VKLHGDSGKISWEVRSQSKENTPGQKKNSILIEIGTSPVLNKAKGGEKGSESRDRGEKK